MPVKIQGLEKFIAELEERGKGADAIKLAEKLDRQIRAQNNDALPHDHIGWDYNESWRDKKESPGEVFGSDYDYWDAVVADTISLWEKYAGGLSNEYRDYIAESIGRLGYGESLGLYRNSLGVWENGQRISSYDGLRGPLIEIGPTVDFGIFMEKHAAPSGFRILQMVGVLHAVAAAVERKWRTVHRVYTATTMPRNGLYALPHRSRPVKLASVIRIIPR